MSSSDKEDKVKIPVFDGDSEKYPVWKIRFLQWEKSKKVSYATSSDKTNELITSEQYETGKKTVIAEDGTSSEVNITNNDRKLYEANATSLNKMIQCMSDNLVEATTLVAGEKESAWLVKQWLDENYGQVTAEDSIKSLEDEWNEVNPSNFEQALFYISKLEDINNRLGKIEAQGVVGKYKKDELQLKIQVLSHLKNLDDNGWAAFLSEYRKKNALNSTSWKDFKHHLITQWKDVGKPTKDGKGDKTGKALHVTAQGGKYFPYKCNHCGKKGHKARFCPDKDKPKDELQGKSTSKKNPSKSGLANKICFGCKKKGHLIKDCPELKKEAEKVEVALMVCQVRDDQDQDWDVPDAFFDKHLKEEEEIEEDWDMVDKDQDWNVPDSFFDENLHLEGETKKADEAWDNIPSWWYDTHEDSDSESEDIPELLVRDDNSSSSEEEDDPVLSGGCCTHAGCSQGHHTIEKCPGGCIDDWSTDSSVPQLVPPRVSDYDSDPSSDSDSSMPALLHRGGDGYDSDSSSDSDSSMPALLPRKVHDWDSESSDSSVPTELLGKGIFPQGLQCCCKGGQQNYCKKNMEAKNGPKCDSDSKSSGSSESSGSTSLPPLIQ